MDSRQLSNQSSQGNAEATLLSHNKKDNYCLLEAWAKQRLNLSVIISPQEVSNAYAIKWRNPTIGYVAPEEKLKQLEETMKQQNIDDYAVLFLTNKFYRSLVITKSIIYNEKYDPKATLESVITNFINTQCTLPACKKSTLSRDCLMTPAEYRTLMSPAETPAMTAPSTVAQGHPALRPLGDGHPFSNTSYITQQLSSATSAAAATQHISTTASTLTRSALASSNPQQASTTMYPIHFSSSIFSSSSSRYPAPPAAQQPSACNRLPTAPNRKH